MTTLIKLYPRIIWINLSNVRKCPLFLNLIILLTEVTQDRHSDPALAGEESQG